MRDKFIQFLTLTLYMCILNVVFYLIGTLCIHHYSQWSASYLNIENIVFIAGYAFFQTVVFPIEKKHSIVISSWFLLTIGLLLTHDDLTGYGNEIWSILVTSISKCNHLLVILLEDNRLLMQSSFFLFFAIYLVFVGYSYKFIYGVLIQWMHTKRYNTTKNFGQQEKQKKM